MISEDLLVSIFLKFFLLMIIMLIAYYIYTSFALMTIAKKTNTPNSWLAWIPIGNLFLMTQIAKVPWWVMLLFLLAFIPVIGALIAVGLLIFLYWKISEARNMPGWLGILMIIPVVNLIIIGILAWKD